MNIGFTPISIPVPTRGTTDILTILAYYLLIALFLLPVAHSASAQTDSVPSTKSCWRTPFHASRLEDGTLALRNQQGTFGRKMLRGGLLVHSMEALGYGALVILPSEISGWSSVTFRNYGANMRRAFTSPPVFDHDKWYINYIGHPYQGTMFYNAVRSQNARVWQASLFTVGHVLVWEYVIESGLEQPSIQDLIVTPVAGIVLGEGIHRATMAMARNGFRWYEMAAVVVLNPMFALNNGFRFTNRPQPGKSPLD